MKYEVEGGDAAGVGQAGALQPGAQEGESKGGDQARDDAQPHGAAQVGDLLAGGADGDASGQRGVLDVLHVQAAAAVQGSREGEDGADGGADGEQGVDHRALRGGAVEQRGVEAGPEAEEEECAHHGEDSVGACGAQLRLSVAEALQRAVADGVREGEAEGGAEDVDDHGAARVGDAQVVSNAHVAGGDDGLNPGH